MRDRPTVLEPAVLAEALSRRSGWDGDRTAIRRTVEAPNFPAAIELVRAVAAVAEEMDHHPDMDIRWRRVTFTLSTHSAGGVTDLDLRLAEEIDRIAAGLAGGG